MATPTHRYVTLRYAVDEPPASWTLSDEPVPESNQHLLTCELLWDILKAWIARAGLDALAGRNLAIRWDSSHPKVGVDPDVYVVSPKPPEGDDVASLLLWKPGHHAPRLAVEVVSPEHPTKDYVIAPEIYGACGVGELWVFDPLLSGPKARGPHRLQVWTRSDDGSFERTHAGEGPAWSSFLKAWIFVTEEGQRIRIADDRAGTKWWPTAEEAERAEKQALAEKVRVLEEELRNRRG